MKQVLQNLLHDIKAAFAILTRIPMSLNDELVQERLAASFWAFPIVGLCLGLGFITIAGGAAQFLPQMIATLLAIGAVLFATGALHEDGLADCADGFWGGHSQERRLQIMKDSQIGSYGTIALIMSLGLRAVGYAALLAADAVWAIPLIFAATRWSMLPVMYSLSNARGAGFAHAVGEPNLRQILIAGGITLAVAILSLPIAIVVLIASLIGAGICAYTARLKIGGYTGDVLGATQQISEIVAILALLALI